MCACFMRGIDHPRVKSTDTAFTEIKNDVIHVTDLIYFVSFLFTIKDGHISSFSKFGECKHIIFGQR